MALIFREFRLESLEDIQELSVKNLRDIFRVYKENTAGNNADLVLKVYVIFMAHVQSRNSDLARTAGQTGPASYCCRETLLHVSPLGWSSDLRNLLSISFIQLYDYLIVTTREYQHIVLTSSKKLKAYQFFFEGHIKTLESKEHNYKL